MSSRLFQEARENRGLCYSVFSFASAYADTGQLGVYAGTDPEDLGELMQVVADETRQLIDDPSEDELARARAQLKASLLMGLESCSSVCEDLARQLLCFGRHIPTEEVVAKIDAVDTAAVRRLGSRLLAGKGLTSGRGGAAGCAAGGGSVGAGRVTAAAQLPQNSRNSGCSRPAIS